MEVCLFNSCILNENESLKKFKKESKEKKIFKYYTSDYTEDLDLLKMMGIGTKPKSFCFCLKHHEQYSKYISLIKIINDEPLTRDDLIDCKISYNILVLNQILDLVSMEPIFKKLICQQIKDFPLYFSGLLYRYDLKVDTLVLLNIMYILKENSICRTYCSQVLEIVCNYYKDIKFDINKILEYKPNEKKKEEKITYKHVFINIDYLVYNYCSNYIRNS